MNQLIIYCEYPEKTVNLYMNAVGLYNPKTEKPIGIKLKYLEDFRKQVAIELNLPEVVYSDSDKIWINSLSGGK